jgi:hypothetical protein
MSNIHHIGCSRSQADDSDDEEDIYSDDDDETGDSEQFLGMNTDTPRAAPGGTPTHKSRKNNDFG